MSRAELRAAMNAFLDANVERLRVRRKGLMDALKTEFEQQYDTPITLNYMSSSVSAYRRSHGITLELNDNPYYTPRQHQPRRRQRDVPPDMIVADDLEDALTQPPNAIERPAWLSNIIADIDASRQ